VIELTTTNVMYVRDALLRQHRAYCELCVGQAYTNSDINPVHLLRAERLISQMFETIQLQSGEIHKLKHEIASAQNEREK
jgi:hypothetical protein